MVLCGINVYDAIVCACVRARVRRRVIDYTLRLKAFFHIFDGNFYSNY